MIVKSIKNFESVRKLLDDNYTIFLKNLLFHIYKIKGNYEIKNFKELKNDSFIISLINPVKDIFNYQTKKISTDFLFNFKDKNIPSSKFLDDLKFQDVIEKIQENSTKLNNSSEENPNILYKINSNIDNKIEVRICKNPKNEKETFLQTWQSSCIINSIKLEEKGIKSIYCDDVFGKPIFSPDGQKLIFLVELDNSKNYKNYFSIKNKKNKRDNTILFEKEKNDDNIENGENDEENNEFFNNMKKFEYRQEFGEALDGKSDPVIAIYDLIRNDIGLVELNLSKKENKKNFKLYPATPFFDKDNNDIIFTGYNFENDNKLGIIFCLKRPSKIYLLKDPKINWKHSEQKEDESKKLFFNNKLFIVSANQIDNEEIEGKNCGMVYKDPKYNYTNVFPILSDDGKYLIYYSNEKATPHMNGFKLMSIKWEEEKKKLENYLIHKFDVQIKNKTDNIEIIETPDFKINNEILIDKINFDNNYFTGIFSYEEIMSKTFFISNDKIVLNSNHQSSNKFYIYDISKNLLIMPYYKINIFVFDSKKINNNPINMFFSVNSFINMYPFVTSWKIDADKYEKIISEITSKISQIRFISEINYSEFEKHEIAFDNIVSLETQNVKITKKNQKIVYLGESYTNEIFNIQQIENENNEYFRNNSYNFSKSNNNNIQNLISTKNTEDLNYADLFKELLLQNEFKDFINELVINTKSQDYKYDDIHGYFIYSDINGEKFKFPYRKRPLVYFIHGGPNGNLSKKFLNIQTLFLSHGYGVLIINYPGSSGYGQNYLNVLNGKIGDLDVKSCGEYLKKFIGENKEKYNLEDNKTMIYGGSHGGYLGSWLISDENYKNLFSSAVLRNPVTDLCSNMACTDIPDWVIGQSTDLDIDKNYPPDEEIYKEFYKKSPVFMAKNATVPTLICLGKQDKRVNYFNGIYLYNSIKHHGCDAKLFIYPDDSHPLSNDETDIDNIFTNLYWMRKHLY